MDRLKGKTAIVFGAGPNIGGTIAHFMAREGAKICVSDIDAKVAEETASFIASRGYDAFAVAGSALDENDVSRAVGETVKRFGQLDIAVNTSGKLHWSPLVDMDLAKWTETLTSYPTAGMVTSKHAARAMIAGQRRGSIIHILFNGRAFRRSLGRGLHGGEGRAVEFFALGGDGPRP